jgi:signal peptidase II
LTITIASDQISKLLIRTNLSHGESIPTSGLIRITYVKNTGSAFGLFQDQTVILILASFVAICILLFFYKSIPLKNWLIQVCIGLQIGGAIGNLIDRIRIGYVVDFIDIGLWPVFNIADSAITVGMIGMLWVLLRSNTKHELPLQNENVELTPPDQD